MSKVLISYFSASGETARLAKTLSEVTGGDLFEIAPTVRYSQADLNWNNKKSRSSIEMEDVTCRPPIAKKVDNMADYDTVYVGFPIWWYIAPRIIETFLESYDFGGKTVIPFATSGGSGMGSTDDVLHTCCSEATNWKTGKLLSSRASSSVVKTWVETLQ